MTSNSGLTGENGSNKTLGRRSYLKMAGAAAIGGTIGANGFTDTASAAIDVTEEDGYEVWTVTSPEVYNISDGEVLENILIDQSHPDGTLSFQVRNKDDWVVRNVGFIGVGYEPDISTKFQFTVSTPEGGYGLIENVWMSGKERDGQRATELGGIYLRASHAGHVDIRHTYIEGYGNNAVYGSAVGKDGHNEGSVTIENAYHRDNTVSQFRIGSPGSSIRNSVGIVDDPEGRRGLYPNSNSQRARCVWGKHFPNQLVENCAFYMSEDDADPHSGLSARYIPNGRSNGSRAEVVVNNSRINTDYPIKTEVVDGPTGDPNKAEVTVNSLTDGPSVQVIQDGGVPLTPEMAARGERSMPPELPGAKEGDTGDSFPDLEHTLTIDGSGDETLYEFTVSGELVKSTDRGASINDGDILDGSTVSGGVWGGEDSYRFDGEITAFALDGDATVLIDGEEVDPVALGDNDLPRTLSIEGSGDESLYEFTVNGELRKSVYNGASINDGDILDGSTASGGVWGGTDSFRFDGEITSFTLDGDATVLVDDQEVDPVELGDGGFDHTLSIEGSGDEALYEFTVSEDFKKSTHNGASINDGDVVDGSSVSGGVWGGTDSFLFNGEITAFTLDGDATVLVDGQEVQPAELGDGGLAHTLSIEGGGSESLYEFTVSGDLEKSTLNNASINDGDILDGSTVTGGVWSGTDSFRFDGEITSFSIDGDATVLVDGQEVDPVTLGDGGLDRTLSIEGNSGESLYQFTVSGDLEKSTLNNASINDGDILDGSTVTGGVWGGVDSYRFDGEITAFTLDGDATVLVDGQEVDPSTLA